MTGCMSFNPQHIVTLKQELSEALSRVQHLKRSDIGGSSLLGFRPSSREAESFV